VAQAHLRSTLGYLDVPTLSQPEVYLHFTANLIDDEPAFSSNQATVTVSNPVIN
jgi:chromate reductase